MLTCYYFFRSRGHSFVRKSSLCVRAQYLIFGFPKIWLHGTAKQYLLLKQPRLTLRLDPFSFHLHIDLLQRLDGNENEDPCAITRSSSRMLPCRHCTKRIQGAWQRCCKQPVDATGTRRRSCRPFCDSWQSHEQLRGTQTCRQFDFRRILTMVPA